MTVSYDNFKDLREHDTASCNYNALPGLNTSVCKCDLKCIEGQFECTSTVHYFTEHGNTPQPGPQSDRRI